MSKGGQTLDRDVAQCQGAGGIEGAPVGLAVGGDSLIDAPVALFWEQLCLDVPGLFLQVLLGTHRLETGRVVLRKLFPLAGGGGVLPAEVSCCRGGGEDLHGGLGGR
ncbi:hypothetical protein Q3O43_28680 (plasmid) [Rhodococcus aetherivorans]|uniref:hypothetical protein n=1 Tax=Rhodococcus aetherivorans TaxID=191292 RepID=UPI0026ECB418|nr:hypothetical protein [Rhodococcus aetherivorans]WKX01753.1 hypothetical protein Q3O43_28680 [Rhodococcus aetherivorans]